MRHGAINTYIRHRCRCSECRFVAAEHRRRVRDRKRGRPHVPNTGAPYQCPECGLLFDWLNALGVHRTRKHYPEHAGLTS